MFRMAKDNWDSRQGSIIPYDKLEHLVVWFLIYLGLYLVSDYQTAFAGAIASGILWEMKDAVVPWEKYGWIGGDGFSVKDLIADIAGILLAVFFLWSF